MNPYEGRIKYRTWEKIGKGLQKAGWIAAFAPLTLTAEAGIEKGVEAAVGHEIISDSAIGSENDRMMTGVIGSVLTAPVGLFFW